MYCELVPGTISADEVRRRSPRGLIFSGGPASVYDEGAPLADPAVYELDIPILGVCYGMQLLAHQLGGAVKAAARREYGHASISIDERDGIFDRLPGEIDVWMSHGDVITEVPPGFHSVAHSMNSPFAAISGPKGRYGIQFHPEVVHTPLGRDILRNFLIDVCGCAGTWEPALVHRDGGRRHPLAGRQRQGSVRAQRRRRLRGGRDARRTRRSATS